MGNCFCGRAFFVHAEPHAVCPQVVDCCTPHVHAAAAGVVAVLNSFEGACLPSDLDYRQEALHVPAKAVPCMP